MNLNETIPVANIASPRNDTSSVIEVAEIAPNGIEVAEVASLIDILENPDAIDAAVYRENEPVSLPPNYYANHLIITPLLTIRKAFIEFFWITLIFNVVYLILNPFSIMLLPVLFLNICALSILTHLVISAVITCNIIAIFIILMSNIIVAINVSNFTRYFIKDPEDSYKIIIIYTPMLFLISFILIIIYIYFINNFLKLSVLYKKLNNEQRTLLYELSD
tara:strand:- start:981 stop:1640 length:660 start_codon:yes stop_codon:yes gene_type:complete